jgi:glycosyltransferase involved in cell wall biosynthesis
MSPTPSTAIVVPCFNEAERLQGDSFVQFSAQHPDVRFVFVDDGSHDATREVLGALCDRLGPAGEVLALEHNGGKAEAVRAGMLRAFEGGCAQAGYWDADLATPLSEIPRFVHTLATHPERLVVFGARVQLLGRAIERRPARHYLGRIFATATSMLLRLAVYDTQCGAKLFRAEPRTRALFEQPFVVNWTFDVELIARLIAGERDRGASGDVSGLIYELPLDEWRDVAGSKVRPSDFLRGMLELWRIRARYLSAHPKRD